MANCPALTFRAVARARLRVPAGGDLGLAERALHKAEAGCPVSNSLSGQRYLTASVEPVDA